jgi:Rhodopirellula transposase DDE domain
MRHASSIAVIYAKYEALATVMDERVRRRWAANEALALGHGGITAVAQATGLAPNTIASGIAELRAPSQPDDGRIRRRGAGCKPITTTDPGLLDALDRLIDPVTRGDPTSPLRWTCKSTRCLAATLTAQGHPVGPRTVARLLQELGYSLQANRKVREGAGHPDRDAQFRHISQRVRALQQKGQPVMAVDTKKKELVGDFKNPGREWQPAGQPEEVRAKDFPDKRLGKGIPYGVYDLTNNQGWVSVGIDHDTAEFAAAAIGRWWDRMGQNRFPDARRLLVTADGGGSNGTRNRLWKVALQGLADRTGLSVCHFPPGTSKWNKIEHRLFCHITRNWRGRPLISHQAIVELIGHTRTQTGLVVEAELDSNLYPTGKKVSEEELGRVKLRRDAFHGEWNYTIYPH